MATMKTNPDLVVDVCLLAILLALHVSGDSREQSDLQLIVVGILVIHLVATTDLVDFFVKTIPSTVVANSPVVDDSSDVVPEVVPEDKPEVVPEVVGSSKSRVDPRVMASARGAFFDDFARSSL